MQDPNDANKDDAGLSVPLSLYGWGSSTDQVSTCIQMMLGSIIGGNAEYPKVFHTFNQSLQIPQ